MIRLFFTLICLAFLAAQQALADDKPLPSLAMNGATQYDTGFTHFNYVNPEAPKGGTLRLGVTGTFDSLNPFIVRGQPAFGLTMVYEPLMARCWDEPFTLYGLIAESVEIPADRSRVIFNLNPAAHFSDGTPITADDVLFSYQTLRDKGRPNHRIYYKKVAAAEKLGDRRVRFVFKPNANGTIDREMPLMMALMPIMPQHDWPPFNKEAHDFNQTSLRFPIGSGPYTITKMDIGRSITYTRDIHYWGQNIPAQKGLYNFDTIHVDYYRDDGIALQAFKAGQFDLRAEMDPNKWATAYDFPAVHDGRVRLEKLEHHRVEPASGFIFNTRRDPFKDKILRDALQYSFDFEWINRNLFQGQYHRTTSFFPNSELAAPTLPEGRELEILQKYKAQLPSDIFTKPVTPPTNEGGEDGLRANLLKAKDMLEKAGYSLRDDQLYTPSGKAVAFEILLSDPTDEKVALTWLRALKRLGINARVHTVDSAQFQARMASFDFDVATGRFVNTLSPGNEQIFYWGSEAADQPGSRNYAGIKDPVVDALARSIPETASREDLVATTHALDRVLMNGHYTIPFYYLGADTIASWATHVRHPDTMSLYGTVREAWWAQ